MSLVAGMRSVVGLHGMTLVLLAASLRFAACQPTLDDLWDSKARFVPVVKIPVGSPGFSAVNAGTRITVMNETWYLFGRADTGPTAKCPGGEISINVRASTDKGRSWGAPSTLVEPDETTTCQYADGSAFYDVGTNTWHYLVQVNARGKGWALAHFSLVGASPLSGVWNPNPHNPVVTGGQLFGSICAGADKHCQPGMVDEGTPQIVEKVGGDFYVTFHGYDYARKAAARGVARTADFVTWEVTGGAQPLPGDVIFAAADCSGWTVQWAKGSCIGSGEASILRAPSGYMYEVIEATDVGLTCDLDWGAQWWPLGLVRSKEWAPSPRWEQMPAGNPFVGGPAGGEPHVGCSIQYNSMHVDNGTTYFSFWDLSFHPASKSASPSTWHLYELAWGTPTVPMVWPGPPQQGPDCSTEASCKATCPGFVKCPTDTVYYCCAAPECSGQHTCSATPGLLGCACNAKPSPPTPDCSTEASCKATCPGFAKCPTDAVYYCCAAPECSGQHTCSATPGLLGCACNAKPSPS
eukprot:TRINITY_DN6297_c0_g1_i1.p1 TRINITY_DN6297_c0_g1~~TRINITY_DN6297_c0_g1_i1.p1  ORF type:complete len:522 (+),score=39.78 TRINITY_DN6297_c0_g1_i1:251-1816(+)